MHSSYQYLYTISTHSRLHHHLDDSTNLLILFYIANRWLAVRFDTITLLLTSATGLFAVLSHGIVPAATIGLAIVYSNQVGRYVIVYSEHKGTGHLW